jgi:hypothetical protein
MRVYYKYVPDAMEIRRSAPVGGEWMALPVTDLVNPTDDNSTQSPRFAKLADMATASPNFEVGDQVMLDVDAAARAWPHPWHTFFFAGAPGYIKKVYMRGERNGQYTKRMNLYKTREPGTQEIHDEGVLYVVDFPEATSMKGFQEQMLAPSEVLLWDVEQAKVELAEAKALYDAAQGGQRQQQITLASELQFMHIGSMITKQAYTMMRSAWVSPDGEAHGVSYSHDSEADEIAQTVYGDAFERSSTFENGYVYLLLRGWLRVSFTNISFATLTAATREWLRQYIEDVCIPSTNSSIRIERWVINRRDFSISQYKMIYDGLAIDAWDAISTQSAQETDGLVATADWEEYLGRLSFDPSTFFQYARPGQIWSYVREGQGPRAGQSVRRFVHLSNVDDVRGQVSGVFGYSWDSVMQATGYPAAARPAADEWQDIRYIASYKPYVDVNDYNVSDQQKAGVS